MNELRIRTATTADAAVLARAAESMFREAFAASNDPPQMDLYCSGHYSEEMQRAELATPGTVVLFAEHGGDIVAFAQVQLATPSTQLHRFYLRRDWHGKGLAQQLMEECLALAREHGADRVWLSVWSENPRAIAFYRKFGFEICGEQPFVLGTEVQRDFVMDRAI